MKGQINSHMACLYTPAADGRGDGERIWGTRQQSPVAPSMTAGRMMRGYSRRAILEDRMVWTRKKS
jgi:hypothetical protein